MKALSDQPLSQQDVTLRQQAQRLVDQGALVDGALCQRTAESYTARLVIRGREYRLLLRKSGEMLSGDCSCGGDHCLHLAAAVIALDRPPIAPRTAHADALPTSVRQSITLHYTMSPSERGGVVIAIVSRCEGEATSRPYRPEWLVSGHQPPAFVGEADRALITELAARPLSSAGAADRFTLPGESDDSLLTRLLASGRFELSLPSTSIPLLPGEGEAPTAVWQIDPEGRQRVAWPGFTLARIGGWWLFDDLTGHSFALNATPTQRTALAALLDRGWVAIESLAAINEELAHCCGVVGSPRPLKRRRSRKVQYERWLKIDTPDAQAVAGLEVDGHLFSAGQSLMRLKGDLLVDYSSALDGESLVSAPLLATGLQPDPDRRWVFDERSGIGWEEWLARHASALQQDGWRLGWRGEPLQRVEEWRWRIGIAEGDSSGRIGLTLRLSGGALATLSDLVGLIGPQRRLEREREWGRREGGVAMETPGHLLELAGQPVLIGGGEWRLLEALLPELGPKSALDRQGMLEIGWLAALRFAPINPQTHPGWRVGWDGVDGAHLLARLDRLRQSGPAQTDQLLRLYQQRGIAWLQGLYHDRFGALLADEMGLGKSLQALYHVALCREQSTLPSLLVAPTSLLHNWWSEAQRFLPQLRLIIYHGSGRQPLPADPGQVDLVVTSYGLARIDPHLQQRRWHLLILDEAQQVRNHRSQLRQALQGFSATQWVALSGTPFENHVGELWSLFDLILPGLLGSHESFQQRLAKPIASGNPVLRAHLARRINPFLLRREKSEVAVELPPRTELLTPVSLGSREQALYERIRAECSSRISESLQEHGVAGSRMTILEGLLRLRQVCCDPGLLPPELLDGPPPRSSKVEALIELIADSLEGGHQILLFSQFARLLERLSQRLESRSIDHVMLTGATRDRVTPVTRFQAGEVGLFLISLRAGGTGLNLTAADIVIHADPWWNPAVERQASDRAHRIGQQRPVFVHHMICSGTVEERVRELQQQKRALFDQLFSEVDDHSPLLDEEAVKWLFSPLSGEQSEREEEWGEEDAT